MTRTQLRVFCDLNGLAFTTQELELLFRRIDKNEDDMITFNDFMKEMGI